MALGLAHVDANSASRSARAEPEFRARVAPDPKRADASGSAFGFWSPVMDAMLNDFAIALEMNALARLVGLSVSQFNRAFRKRFGTTPYACLSDIRLNAACKLLLASDASMAQIAARTGFYDQSHFANRFARRYGVPPSQYRAACTQVDERARVSSNEVSVVYMLRGGAQS